jgi:NADH dehydrogenase
VLLAEVRGVDLKRRIVETDAGPVPYDFVVVATGAETSYFGRDEWKSTALGLKSVDDALDIRRRVLLAFEQAERIALAAEAGADDDAARRETLLSFVVIGAGPTGVELAGALAELSRVVLARDFRSIDPRATRVTLIEGGPRLLPTFHVSLSKRAQEQLQELGVQVITGARVERVGPEGVVLQDGRHIAAGTVLWAAGVRPSGLAKRIDTEHDRQGRLVVTPDLTLPGHPEAFAIGDVASFVQDGEPLPGVSPVAMQQGRAVARAIRATLAGEPRSPFRYWDKGMMATIGRSRAVAEMRLLKLSGFAAWLAWLLVHIWYLIGFRNRLIVMFEWTWSYLTFKRGARVITGLHEPPGLEPRAGEDTARATQPSDGHAEAPGTPPLH